MIDEVSIHEDFSVGTYLDRSLDTLKDEFQKSDVVIIAGGSGLYIKALTEGIDIFPGVKEEDKAFYNNLFEQEGIGVLQKELENKDLSYY